MTDETKNTMWSTLAEPIANTAKNITDKPSKNIGTTFADIWYLVFGGISHTADKRKLKYSYAIQEFEKELKEDISKIPKSKLVEPDLQVIAPALEASKYCIEKEELRYLFCKLISSSMNTDYCDYLHPLFSMIIQQLSVFDAKVFKIIYDNDTKSFMKLIENNLNSFQEFINLLSSSLTILRNFGLIFGVKRYSVFDVKDYDDMFNPNCLYSIIKETLFYENKTVLNKINEYSDLFENHFLMAETVAFEKENLYFVKTTPLGKNFGICCCQ